jgi:hypothetical protein
MGITGRVRLLVAVGAVGAVVVLATGLAIGRDPGKVLPPNPEASMTEQQRQSFEASLSASFETRYAAWIANLDVSNIDLTKVEHDELLVSSVAPVTSLSAAVKKADQIIVGTVTALKPTTNGVIVTLGVERSVKGSAATTVTISQGSNFLPTEDWQRVTVGDDPGGPMLLPGQRVELLLFTGSTGMSEVEGYTGTYYLDAGGVRPLTGNPFAASVSGISELQFGDLTKSAQSAP